MRLLRDSDERGEDTTTIKEKENGHCGYEKRRAKDHYTACLKTVAGVLAVVVCLPLFIGMFAEMRKRLL